MLQSGAAAVIWSLMEIQDALGVAGDVAEIGVYQGRTLLFLCRALNRGERAHGFDRFGIPAGSNTEWPARLQENVGAAGLGDGTVSIHTMDSTAFAPDAFVDLLDRRPVRLFSVDGDHSLAAVRHDLSLAAASLGEGGLILADDLFNPWYPTVTEALYDFFRDDPGDLEPVAMIAANGPVATGAGKLVIGRRRHAPLYKAGLKILNRDDLKHCDPFAGYPDVPTFYFEGTPVKHRLDENLLAIFRDVIAGIGG